MTISRCHSDYGRRSSKSRVFPTQIVIIIIFALSDLLISNQVLADKTAGQRFNPALHSVEEEKSSTQKKRFIQPYLSTRFSRIQSSTRATRKPNLSNTQHHLFTSTNKDKNNPFGKTVMTFSASDSYLHSAGFRLLLLALMVIQNSSVVLIGRFTRSETAETFIVSHFILVTEIAKLLGSCLLEHYNTNGKLISSFRKNILQKPMMETFKISIPAILYLLQNSLLYVALSNLSAPLFQVLYQAKLLTTALISVVMLDRRYTAKQWVCLTTLGLGVAIVVLGENQQKEGGTSSSNGTPQNMLKGLISVTISCFSSAIAGVYFEKVLKKAPQKDGEPPEQPMSMWMRNVQLAMFSVIIAYGQLIYQASEAGSTKAGIAEAKPFFYGFDFWVWVLVALQAGGGLLIAAIMKYADNVLKGLATGVAVAVSTFCSVILFGTPLTFRFCVGATVILCSVYWFSNSGTSSLHSKKDSPSSTTKSEQEMKPILQSV